MTNETKRLFTCGLILATITASYAQPVQIPGKDTVLSAGPEYKTSSFHQWLWGRNYRMDWAAPVKVPIIQLDKTLGGLKPVKAGGGNQTKSLQVQAPDGGLYALRTVNKTLGKVLPEEFLGTFIEDIVNDKVSMSHPYGAAVVPGLARAAKVYHTTPQYTYMPRQKALDTFNTVFADRLYLFEQKIDNDWKNADNLGNYSNYKSTEKLLKEMREDNDHRVNQPAYVRARLLDFLINDWDRHEDQWEWGEREYEDSTIYTAVPQDRDQAFFTYNGVLLKMMIGASGLNYFQPFNEDFKDVRTFNYEQRNLDRFFANQVTRAEWQQIAADVQQRITDAVIETAVKQLPPESFASSGEKIANTLKARRNKLVDWANDYYEFLAKEVDIPGSAKHEFFNVERLADGNTQVRIYKLSNEGERKEQLYSRLFDANETREIRLYGLAGNDRFNVKGNNDADIRVRLIGGIEKDSVTVTGRNVHYYDNEGNVTDLSPATRVHLSEDTTINSYKYASYKYSKRGLGPNIFYSNDDRLFVGLAYSILSHKWRKEPFASKQQLQANYSISQQAFSFIYNGLFPMTFGKTDLALRGMYDQVKWTNFFGLGNETDFIGDDIDFYRSRTEEWEANVGLIRRTGKHMLGLNGLYQNIRVLQDTGRFIGKVVIDPTNDQFTAKNFAGAVLSYNFVDVNDAVTPTKGVWLQANLGFTQNLEETERQVGKLAADLHWYLPLFADLSLAIRAGGETVAGDPEFYQYASIGGSQQMRAFRRGRYWGKSGVYNSNGLRWIKDVKSYLYNGKAGLMAFYDNGRVWMPNEKSNVWHDGYGFGVFLAPFNKLSAEITYGFSRDDRLIQLRLSRNL